MTPDELGQRRTARDESVRQQLEALTMDLQLAEKDLRPWRLRVEFLLANEELARQHYPRRAEVLDVIQEWREVHKRPKCRVTPGRFDAVRLCFDVTLPAPYKRETFSRAIAGEAFDPSWVKRLRNGSKLSVNGDIARICRDGGQYLEEAANRAPRGWAYVERPIPERGPREDAERESAELRVYKLAEMIVAQGKPAAAK